ncbi:MAG: hypothetical protein AAF990_16270, partial [Bacteroidota bacterium]
MNLRQTCSYLLLPLLCMLACTPKVSDSTTQTETPTETTTTTPPEEEVSSTCRNWNNNPRKDEIIENHVLYKDRLREIRTEQRKGATADAQKIDSL